MKKPDQTHVLDAADAKSEATKLLEAGLTMCMRLREFAAADHVLEALRSIADGNCADRKRSEDRDVVN